MKPIIRVENLSKQYRIGGQQTHYSTLRESIVNALKTPLRTFRRGEEDNRNLFWALRDVSFEVAPGEVLGIIGRNGAGKSTLLKILSRITESTSGRVELYGRVGSLLEVGTGFHPELTGRENIFLNGSILGMKRKEIERKFDEIVDFAGIEKHLDTVIKKYSSGMYTRLAFAVAAHLDPEIMIVDEVLAVGDNEFQKKCLGKMKDISQNQGRTVIFVSHNMEAIENLCQRAILLQNGTIKFQGDVRQTVNKYLERRYTKANLEELEERSGNQQIKITSVRYFSENNRETNQILCGDELKITVKFDKKIASIAKNDFRVDVGINTFKSERVVWLSTVMKSIDFKNMSDEISFIIPKFNLMPNSYNLNIECSIDKEIADWIQEIAPFEVLPTDYYKSGKSIPQNQGYILLDYQIS